MAIDDTTFALTRTSNARKYKEKSVVHYDFDAEFKAVVDVDPDSICELDVQFCANAPKVYLSTADDMGIPGAYSAFVLCTEVSCERWPDRKDHFKVTAKFTTNYQEDRDDSQEGDDPNDPTTWHTIAKIQRQKVQRPLGLGFKDLDDKLYATSAGELFSDAPMKTVDLLTWRAYQYLPASSTITNLEDRNNVMNDDAWQGFAARTVKASIVEDEFGTFGTPLLVRRILVEFAYDPDNWLEKRQDMGFFYMIDSGGAKDPSNWAAFANNSLGPLNGSGVPASTPSDLTFRFVKEADFSALFKVVFVQ